jgi:REP element-mobilizing transposase RayT
LIRKKAEELGCELLAVGAVEDHIHILVSVSPKTTVPELVKHFKGTTSHLINHELYPETPFKWQGGYGAFSVSKANLPKTKAYIENQRQHHADGTVVAYYENWDRIARD